MLKAIWIWRVLPFCHEDGGKTLVSLHRNTRRHIPDNLSRLHSSFRRKFTKTSYTTLKYLNRQKKEHSMQLEATNTNCTTSQTTIVMIQYPYNSYIIIMIISNGRILYTTEEMPTHSLKRRPAFFKRSVAYCGI